MPKEATPKLGNLKFDNKRPYPDLPLPLNRKDYKQNLEYLHAQELLLLLDLMEHFGIDPKHKFSWMELSFRLAKHYVPGMQTFKREGQPKKWNNDICWKLHALYELNRKKHPNLSKKETFNLLPKLIKDSCLSTTLKNVKPQRLQDEYEKYTAKQNFKIRSATIDSSFNSIEKIKYYEEILKKEPSSKFITYQKKIKRTIKNDAVLSFFALQKIKNTQNNYDFLVDTLGGHTKAQALFDTISGKKTGT